MQEITGYVGTLQEDMADGIDNVLQWDLTGRKGTDKPHDFFGELSEGFAQPVSVACTTHTHPDTLLRRLGVIEGRGTLSKNRRCFFDARVGAWLYEDTHIPVGNPQDILHRSDRHPKGIIQVVGSLKDVMSRAPKQATKIIDTSSDTSLRDLVDPTVVFQSQDLVQKIHIEKLRKQQELKHLDEHSNKTAPDNVETAQHKRRPRQTERPATAERLDCLKLYQQYLSKGVVDAARRTESCIIAPGDGKISVFLASGVESKQDKGVGGIQNTEIRPTHTLLIGVSAHGDDLYDRDCPKPRRLNEFFTHHIVVERNTQPDEVEEIDDETFGIATPVQGLKIDGLHTQARVAKRLTEKLRNEKNFFSFGASKTQSCTGFRCSHVFGDGSPIVEDADGHPLHCRVRDISSCDGFEEPNEDENNNNNNNNNIAFYSSDEEDEEDEEYYEDDSSYTNSRPGTAHLGDSKHLTEEEQEALRVKLLCRRKRLQKLKDFDTRFVDSLPPAGWELCRRLCECGAELGPFDVARCVCGKYDFQHIPREVKRNRKKALSRYIKDQKYLLFAAFMACPVERTPTKHELHRYTADLLTVLSQGFHPDTDRNKYLKRNPPRRHNLPVISVLFGGTHIEKFHLISHVQKRWPIIVIEGSGGYADVLCSIINKVRQIVKVSNVVSTKAGAEGGPDKDKAQKGQVNQAGLDEYRKFLSGIDSTTAEILVNGHVELIKKHSKTNEFTRKLENCLNGNETLEKAWVLYSKWGYNAEIQRQRYFWFNLLIVVMAVITTAASVTQSFVLLLYEDSAPPDMFNQPQLTWIILRWSVITLPIVSTLFQAIANRYASGPKWVRLKCASEKLLSEIYKYRTTTLEYASNRLKTRVDRNPDAKDDDSPAFSSREELLQQRCHALTDFLSDSEVANVTLSPYEGSLPPKHIRRNGDDGFSELGPDRYIRIRLETKTLDLQERALREGRTVSIAVFLINLCNAVGTMMAALAAYGLGYMQAWVALTTALSSSFIRWLDFSRLAYLNNKMNVTVNNLGSVVVWWSGQGANADNKEDRDRLVEDTENFILEETLLWGKIIHGTKESNSVDGDASANSKNTTKCSSEKKKLKCLGAKYGIELEDLECDKLYEALDKPSGSTSKGVKEAMTKLAQLGLAPVYKKPVVEEPPPQPTVTPTAPHDSVITSEILQCLRFHQTKSRFLTLLLRVNNHRKAINSWSILNATKEFPELHRQVKDMRTRNLLEVVKSLAVDAIFDYFLQDAHYSSMSTMTQKRFVPKRAQLLLRSEHDTDECYSQESLISDLRALARMEHASALNSTGILNVIKDPDIKKMLRKLPEPIWTSMRDAAVSLWNFPAEAALMSRDHSTAVLLEDVTELIAELDVDDLLQNFETRVKIWARAPSYFSESSSAALSKQQLMQDLPITVTRYLERRSALQIQKYFVQFSRGTEAARVFRQVHHKFDRQLANHHNGAVFHPAGDLELRERVVLSCELLDQIAINRQSRGALMKKLKICTVYNEQVNKIFLNMTETEFKFLLSTIQAKMNNTYASRLLDRAADEINSFDCRKAIPSSEALKLVNRLKEFQRMQMYSRDVDDDKANLPHATPPQEETNSAASTYSGFSVASLSRKQIFSMLDYRSLIKQVSPLTEDQIKELLLVLLGLSARSYPILVFSKIREVMPVLNAPHINDVVQDFDPEFIDNLIYVAWNGVVPIRSLSEMAAKDVDSVGTEDVIEVVSSNLEVCEGLTSLRDSGRKTGMSEADVTAMLLQLLNTVIDLGGDRMTSVSFESAGVSSGFPHDLQKMFPGPTERQELLELLETLPTLELHHLFYVSGEGDTLKTADELFANLFADGSQAQNTERFPHAFLALSTIKAMDDRKFTQILAHLLIELTIETPLRMFHDLASRISMFDVRDVFCGYDCRRSLFIFVFETFLAPGCVNNACDIIISEGVELVENWINRKIGDIRIPRQETTMPQQTHPPGKWRLDIVRSLGARVALSPEYTTLLDGLRVLTEVQLKVLIEESCLFLTGTVAGRLYTSYLTKAKHDCGSDARWYRWVQHNTCIDGLRQKMKTQPDYVAKQFDDFNANSFHTRYQDARERAVTNLVYSEQSRKLVLDMFPVELERELFTYLKTFGPIPRAMYMKVTRKFRNDQWKALLTKNLALGAWKLGTQRAQVRTQIGVTRSNEGAAYPGALT